MECGAGNYGADGHTKKSQRLTVLSQLSYVSSLKNYTHNLPEKDDKPYDPAHQYAVLFWTLDQLIEKKGPEGIFHVNDLIAEYAQSAVFRLRQYARQKGYTGIKILPIPGDYLKILSENTLKAYGLRYYNSVHLKNPEVSFYHYGMNGDIMIANVESRAKARHKLQFLANLSQEGLYFFPIDYEKYFIPIEEKREFIDKNIFYLPTDTWPPISYYFPEGGTFPKQYGRVYFIQHNRH